MQKTIKEWLEELPEPYRTQALNNLSVKPDHIYESIGESVLGAFEWGLSPEGWEYWNKIHNELLEAKPSYWEERCKLAEAYIEASPCDPDITAEQIVAWRAYNSFLKERNEN